MGQNAYLDSYRAIGNREDLIDLITTISPTDTVFMSRIGKKTASHRTHEWLTQALAARDSGNSVVEGASATFASGDLTVRVRITGYTQISRRVWSTSYTQDAVDKAGVRGTEFDNQRMLKTKELSNDMNAVLINQSSASGDSATARTLNGMLAAITTNTAAGNSQPISQGTFNGLLQDIWSQGGKPNAVYVGGFNKRTISDWSQPIQRTTEASGKKLTVSVNTYDSDFGRLLILLDRDMPASQIAVLEEQYWATAFLRPLEFEELNRVGEQRRGSVVSEYTLEYLAENSSGKITGTATA